MQVVIISFKVHISDTEMKRMKKKTEKNTFFNNFLFFFFHFCPASQPGKSRDKRSGKMETLEMMPLNLYLFFGE